MKKERKRSVFGWLVILAIFTVRSGFPAASPDGVVPSPSGLSGAAEPYQNNELERFFKVKAQVFSRDWAAVRSGMGQYLKDYPSGKMRDEALYWLAQSQDRLAGEESETSRVIVLKQSALEALDRLIREFPDSLWRDDGREFRVRIAGQLVLLGESQHRNIILEALKTQNKSEADLKATALRSLANLDPKTAIPTLWQVVQTDGDAGIRKKCVEVLGRRFTREVVGILEDVTKNDRDEEVRREAGYWLGKIRTRLIPTQLNYYCFEARLTDPLEYAKVPEGKVAAFQIPHGRPGSESRAKSGISRAFNGRISFWGSRATSKDATSPWDFLKDQGTTILTSHKINNFRIALDSGSVTKTAENIEGRVRFDDMVSAFKVNDQNDVLLAARRGERLAVMYLEMAPKDVEASGLADDEESITGLQSTLASIAKMFQQEPKEPVYYTSTNTMGIVINSTLQSTDESFMKDISDYSLAEAKIPGAGGTWTLTGHLLLKNKERVLIGRMAKLVRPDGSTAATGDEIRVPVKDPAAFTTAGGKVEAGKEKPSEPEAAGDLKYPISFNLEDGGWIYTTRTSFSIEEFNREAVDCGTAKALISGQGGTWILTGRLVLLNKERIIVARDAVLMNSEGKITARGALMMVPLKQPETYTLVTERSN